MRQWLVQLTAGFLGRCGLDYQFRKHMGLSQSVPIRLTGKMTVC